MSSCQMGDDWTGVSICFKSRMGSWRAWSCRVMFRRIAVFFTSTFPAGRIIFWVVTWHKWVDRIGLNIVRNKWPEGVGRVIAHFVVFIVIVETSTRWVIMVNGFAICTMHARRICVAAAKAVGAFLEFIEIEWKRLKIGGCWWVWDYWWLWAQWGMTRIVRLTR